MAISVYVGMSGGVDSSVAAALLKAQGYQVTGVYMKNWTQDLPGMKCPWAEDVADAKRVAVRLGIPFKVFDFQKEYKQKVVDYMIAEYAAGRTPNPDVMCNQEIKFRLFLDTALEDGADMIATGHYARIATDSPAEGENIQTFGLMTAADTAKDQTYFLYRVTEKALATTLFPLGGMTKREVRAYAARKGLTTATKKDSQGICFVGKVGIKDFLQHYITASPGDIIDTRTKAVIGRHDGAIFYTFGQRHGLGVGGGLPYYVIGKDMDKNEVYVTSDLNDNSLWRAVIRLTDLHWIAGPPAAGITYKVRTRYRAPLIDCTFRDNTVTLAEPERAIAPGQSAVLYCDERVIGGGIVAAVV